eukprot:5184987-Prymnesium_polylepis.1
MPASNEVWMRAYRNRLDELAGTLEAASSEDIDRPFTRMWTPLYAATSKGHVDAVRMLLQYGARVSLVTDKAWTPLMAAAAGGHSEIAQLLLDFGADPKVKNNQGMRAIALARTAGMEECEQLLEKAPQIHDAFVELNLCVDQQPAPTAPALVTALEKAVSVGLGGPAVVRGTEALASIRSLDSAGVDAGHVDGVLEQLSANVRRSCVGEADTEPSP